MSHPTTLGDLFTQEEAAALAKHHAERAAENADPALAAKRRAEAIARAARLEAEYDAADEEEDDEDDEDDEEEDDEEITNE